MTAKRSLQEALDDKSEAMLQVMFEQGGEATTSDFKKELGFESHKIHYRYDKLQDLGLITTHQPTSETNVVPPKVAELTEKAEKEIKKGRIGDVFEESDTPEEVTVSEEEFEQFQSSLQQLETRINTLKDAVDKLEKSGVSSGSDGDGLSSEDMKVVKSRFDEVASELREVKKDAKKAQKKAEETEEQLDNFKEKFNNNFLPFLRATRTALGEELDINVMDYYEEDM